MKILYCLAGTFNSGGMERIVIDKANWLSDNGHEVSIITTEQDGRNNFYKLNNTISRIDLDIMYSNTNTPNPILKYLRRTKCLKLHRDRLQEAVNNINPDIIISTFGNEVGLIPKLKTNAKKIAEIHFSRWFRLQLNRKGVWRLIDSYLTYQDKNRLSRFDKFVCLTEEDKINWGYVNNLKVIPNFIDSISPEPVELKSHSMIAVGRLNYQKGFDRLIKSWAIVHKKFPDWILNIYGGGELEDSLKDLVNSLNLQSNIFIHPPTKEITEEYRKNSALILSSRYEGLPMVMLEAMSNGLPSVAFKCQCGPKDIITDKKNGLLVENGDIDGLASAILMLIENEKLRKELGRNAYYMISQYQKDYIMPLWIDLFDSMIKGKEYVK